MIGMIEICSHYPNQVSEVSQAPRKTYKKYFTEEKGEDRVCLEHAVTEALAFP